MLPTKIHAWFLQYNVDPMIGWEVVEIATDDLAEITDEPMLFDHCHTYIVSMLDSTIDEPDYDRLGFLQTHLIPLIRSLSPYFTSGQRADIYNAAADTEFISTSVRVALHLP
jgi:hypothetical protein